MIFRVTIALFLSFIVCLASFLDGTQCPSLDYKFDVFAPPFIENIARHVPASCSAVPRGHSARPYSSENHVVVSIASIRY